MGKMVQARANVKFRSLNNGKGVYSHTGTRVVIQKKKRNKPSQ